MLEFKLIEIQNFLSYGDYPTVMKLDNLGPTLITSEVIAGETIESDISNGAGKSNLINAILWCLFGRTMHRENPGDQVINYFTKKDCKVIITFKNGDKLTRTRNCDGHNELLFVKNGEDATVGTTSMQQEVINKELNLDWDMFCGSTFYTQFGKSWMEMSDQKRRQALEREFHLDRVTLYAEVSKEKADRIELEQSKLLDNIKSIETLINNLLSEADKLNIAAKEFETNKTKRIKAAEEILTGLEKSRDSIKLIDIQALKSKWDIIIKAQDIIRNNNLELNKKDNNIRTIEKKIASIEGIIKHIRNDIKNVEAKSGESCSECGRPWTDDCIRDATKPSTDKIASYGSELLNYTAQLDNAKTDYQNYKSKIETGNDNIESKKPSLTVKQAEDNNSEYHKRCKIVENQEKQIEMIRGETNNYIESNQALMAKIGGHKANIAELQSKIKKLDVALKHYSYIYNAYNDRRKIKSYILKEYIPYLNTRIAYYLNKFSLDLKLEFTDALGIKSNMWGYEFCSGGERKRMDVAIMLALFDLHAVMYGRQCNIVVFDEAERSLDAHGVNCLINIIKEDIAERVDSVLVISHCNTMKGAFQSEIKIIREDRFSKVIETK